MAALANESHPLVSKMKQGVNMVNKTHINLRVNFKEMLMAILFLLEIKEDLATVDPKKYPNLNKACKCMKKFHDVAVLLGLGLGYSQFTKYASIAKSLKETIHGNADVEILDTLGIDSWTAAQTFLIPSAVEEDEFEKRFEKIEVSPSKKLNAIQNRKGEDVNDVFFTPNSVASIMVAMAEKYSKRGDIWMEPCKGGGSILNLFPDQGSSIWCELDEDVDFFQDDRKFDICVTNPPFSIYTTFLERILLTHPRVIVLLFGCLNLSAKRMEMLINEGYVLVHVHQCYWNVIFGTSCFLHCWVLKKYADDTTTTFTMDTSLSKSKIGGDKPSAAEED